MGRYNNAFKTASGKTRMRKSTLALIAILLLASGCGQQSVNENKNGQQGNNDPYQPVENYDPAKVEKPVEKNSNLIPGDGMATFDTTTMVKVLDLPGSPVLVTDKYFNMLYGASDAKGAVKIVDILKKDKVDHLDYVILATTSPSEVAGALVLVNSKINVGTYGLIRGIQADNYKSLIDTLSKKMIMFEFENAGGKWKINGCTFEILYPMTSDVANDEYAEKTCVMRLERDGVSVILTGNITEKIEQKLLDRGKIKPSTYIVVTGGNGLLTKEFIEAAKPEKVIVGYGSQLLSGDFGVDTVQVKESNAASFVLGKRIDLKK